MSELLKGIFFDVLILSDGFWDPSGRNYAPKSVFYITDLTVRIN